MAAQAITSQDINGLTGRTYPAVGSGVPSPLAVLRRLRTWYERNRQYRQTVSELSSLSDHVLADIGIGRYQIHEVARTLSGRAA